MSYWIIDDKITTALVASIYFTGNEKTFAAQLVIEDGETFDDAYLVVTHAGFAGLISVTVGELGGEPGREMVLMAFGDATAYIGTLVGPRELELTFAFNFPAVKAGEFAIPIRLGYGDGLPGATPSTMTGESDSDSLWADEECESPLWTSVEGARPLFEESGGVNYPRQTYARELPGESLTFGDVVYLDTTGGGRLLKLARNDGTLAEAAAIGIVDDGSINYQFRDGGAVASDGDSTIYWHGGEVDGITVSTMSRLDWPTRLWYAMTTALQVRKHHTLIYHNGKLYAWGGVDESGNFLNSLEAYDEYSETWETLTAGGTARALHAAFLVGDEIHFVGGVNRDGVIRSVDIYSTVGDYWFAGELAPVGLASLQIAVSPTLQRPYWMDCDGTLYYGDSTAGRSKRFYSYDSSGVWGALVQLPPSITPARGALPNIPLFPDGSFPQYCTRIQPDGEGASYWVCMDTEDNGSGI